MNESYDIINQLGPRNRFDRIAGEALAESEKYKDRILADLGAELATLVKTIRYDSDKYYLIIAKAQEIEERIRKHEALEKEDFFSSPMGNEFDYSFDPHSNSFVVSTGNGRTKEDISGDPAMKESKLRFAQLIESLGPVSKDIRDGKNFHYEVWMDSNKKVVYISAKWVHASAVEFGFTESFRFYDLKVAAEAREIFNEIKQNLSSRS